MKKNNKPQKEKKPYIKTRERNNGIEVELRTSPSKTIVGKVFAIAIAAITVLGGLLGLIWALISLM